MSKSFSRTYCTVLNLLILAVIIYAAYAMLASAGITAVLFEDGSFILGNVTGCIPGALCALP